MTIDQLLGKSADELEAMSKEELESYFAPYLKFTRPELIEKPVEYTQRKVSLSPEEFAKKQKREKARAMAKQLGIDLGI